MSSIIRAEISNIEFGIQETIRPNVRLANRPLAVYGVTCFFRHLTPTQRSLAHLRKLGYTAEIVEKWNPHVRIRQDFAGFADIIAFKTAEIVAVQTTSGSNLAARQKKILDSEKAHLWVKAGGIIVLHGWSKKGPRGKRKLWTITERVLVP